MDMKQSILYQALHRYPENTTTSESTSIVIQTVTLCFIPESVVLRASAR